MAVINLGNIRFNWRGSYDNKATYIKNDVIEHSGSCFIAKKETKSIAVDNKEHWDLMIAGSENPEQLKHLSEEFKKIKNKTDNLKLSANKDINVTYLTSQTSKGMSIGFSVYGKDSNGESSLVFWDDEHPNKGLWTNGIALYVGKNKIPNINEIFKLGDFRLYPFPPNELPAGWYLRNGDRHPSDSKIGQALKSLSAEYRRLWNIVEKDGHINLPNAFNINGDGYFERAVNGINRQVGSVQLDAMQTMTGKFWFGGVSTGNSMESYGEGAFKSVMKSDNNIDRYGSGASRGNAVIEFKNSLVTRTAHENRPLNIGMTPAIYLGV